MLIYDFKLSGYRISNIFEPGVQEWSKTRGILAISHGFLTILRPLVQIYLKFCTLKV